MVFQSTLPRGERHGCTWFPYRSCYFNPRSHEGSDAEPKDTGLGMVWISIHAPTRGATRCAGNNDQPGAISIHAPTRGATVSCRGDDVLYLGISIHAPTRGATYLEINPFISQIYFNPRSHEGSDPVDDNSRTIVTDFNPRSHEGSDWHDGICAGQ